MKMFDIISNYYDKQMALVRINYITALQSSNTKVYDPQIRGFIPLSESLKIKLKPFSLNN